MSQYNSQAVNDILKIRYADEIINLVPDDNSLAKLFPFKEDKLIGKTYNQPVVLTSEHGITFAPSTSTPTLVTASAGVTSQAAVDGYQMIFRSQVAMALLAKANSDQTAFEKGMDYIVRRLMDSSTRYLETEILYGGKGLGTVQTVAAIDSTDTLVTFTTQSWGDGIWSGMEGKPLNFYQGSTEIGTGGVAADVLFTITAVDPINRTLTVSSSSTGSTALVASGTGSVAYFDSAYGNEFTGANGILTNTGSLFGIDASVYGLWKSNTYDALGAPLTPSKLWAALSIAVARGLRGPATLICNPKTWVNLNSSLAALRLFDSSYSSKEAEIGSEKLSFMGPQGSRVDVLSTAVCKQGEAMIVPNKYAARIGAMEWGFMSPPTGEDNAYLWPVPDVAAMELRLFTDQAVFIEAPAQCVLIKNITNSAI